MLKRLKVIPFVFLTFSNMSYSVPLPKPTPKHTIVDTSTLKKNQRSNNTKVITYNKKYAGKSIAIGKIIPKLAVKYIKPIKFNKYGYPDFSKYSKLDIKTSKLTGNHKKDIKIVEKIAKKKFPKWKKRIGYTWHYHQDGKTMQYIPRDLHSAISHKVNNLKINQRSGKNRYRDNNGRLLRNHKYAGKSIRIGKIAPKLARKYPKFIKFNKYGYPDFSKYSKLDIKTSKLTGNHQKDVKIVEKITKKKFPKWKKIVGYTWHHHQDGKTMQYVPTDLHSSIPHSGGASRLRVLKNK